MPRNLNNVRMANGYTIQKPTIPQEWSSIYMNKTNQGTGNCGKIIPVYMRELIPNQTVNVTQDIAIQFTPFVSNLFHEMKGELITYFVPYRICAFMRETENYGDTIDGETINDIREEADELKWEAYINGGLTGTLNISLPIVYWNNFATIQTAEKVIGTLGDYFGLPISNMTAGYNTETNSSINMLPWNAYNLIYNQHFRNPDFTQWKRMLVDTTAHFTETNAVATAYWNTDRFTAARKWQQRGIVPSIPIQSELIELAHNLTAGADGTPLASQSPYYSNQRGNPAAGTPKIEANENTATFSITGSTTENGTPNGLPWGDTSSLTIENHTIPAGTITANMNYNDFIYNLAILRYEVNNARIKPRYTEFLKYRFGIFPQDARFQEPEFIASNHFNIGVDTNQATGSGSATIESETINTAQGNITGQAWGGGLKMGYSYHAQEHGLLMTLMIIRPIGVYEGGLERFWKGSRTRFDFPTPELYNTPDVAITKGELHFTGVKENDDALFGWQSIYDEYRTETNQVCGRLRPSIADNLKSYTLARYFSEAPNLNDNFLKCNPAMERIKQYTNEPDFIFFHRNETRTAIPLPLINEPTNLNL